MPESRAVQYQVVGELIERRRTLVAIDNLGEDGKLRRSQGTWREGFVVKRSDASRCLSQRGAKALTTCRQSGVAHCSSPPGPLWAAISPLRACPLRLPSYGHMLVFETGICLYCRFSGRRRRVRHRAATPSATPN